MNEMMMIDNIKISPTKNLELLVPWSTDPIRHLFSMVFVRGNSQVQNYNNEVHSLEQLENKFSMHSLLLNEKFFSAQVHIALILYCVENWGLCSTDRYFLSEESLVRK